MKLFCSAILLILGLSSGLSSAAAQPAGTGRAAPSSASQKEPVLDAEAGQKAVASGARTDQPGAREPPRIATRPPTPLVRR